MITISEIREQGIAVTWTLLSLCYGCRAILDGGGWQPRFVSAEDVVAYAANGIISEDGDALLELACLRPAPGDEEVIEELLGRLSDAERADRCRELRKFRALYVWKNLPGSELDNTRGVIALVELWVQFDFPAGTPGHGLNHVSYSDADYARLRRRSELWVQAELRTVRSC